MNGVESPGTLKLCSRNENSGTKPVQKAIFIGTTRYFMVTVKRTQANGKKEFITLLIPFSFVPNQHHGTGNHFKTKD